MDAVTLEVARRGAHSANDIGSRAQDVDTNLGELAHGPVLDRDTGEASAIERHTVADTAVDDTNVAGFVLGARLVGNAVTVDPVTIEIEGDVRRTDDDAVARAVDEVVRQL